MRRSELKPAGIFQPARKVENREERRRFRPVFRGIRAARLTGFPQNQRSSAAHFAGG